MWRIRHVLAERQKAWENGVKDFAAEYQKIFDEFEEGYLGAEDYLDSEMEGRLERFKLAFFGIDSNFSSKDVNETTVKGVKKVASLKLGRFVSTLPEDIQEQIGELKDIKEAYLIYVAPHTPEGIQDAVSTILTYRKDISEPIPSDQDIPTLVSLLKTYEKLGAQEE